MHSFQMKTTTTEAAHLLRALNLMPHDVTVYAADGKTVIARAPAAPADQVLRLASTEELSSHEPLEGVVPVGGPQIIEHGLGTLRGWSIDTHDHTRPIIVNELCGQHLRDTGDPRLAAIGVYSVCTAPGADVRDATGSICGCKRFTRWI